MPCLPFVGTNRKHDYRLAAGLRLHITLNDEGNVSPYVIDLYLNLLKERANRDSMTNPNLKKVFVIDAEQVEAIQRLNGKNEVRPLMERFGHTRAMFDRNQMILAPMWHKDHMWDDFHWSLAVIYNDTGTITHFDPMREAIWMQKLQKLMFYMFGIAALHDLDCSYNIKNNTEVPQASYEYDTGIFVCAYADFITRGALDPLCHTDAGQLRKYRPIMAYELKTRSLTERPTNRQLLTAYGVPDLPDYPPAHAGPSAYDRNPALYDKRSERYRKDFPRAYAAAANDEIR